jgi:DNA-directed RNA polymerase subunit K/omega
MAVPARVVFTRSADAKAALPPASPQPPPRPAAPTLVPRCEKVPAIVRGPREMVGLMNKYERARVLGTRALQLASGAPPRVSLKVVRSGKTVWLSDPLEIADEELARHKLALNIGRSLHAGAPTEIWHVSELALQPGDPLPSLA